MELKLRQQTRQLTRLLLRRAREDRIAVKVDEQNTAPAPHQPPGGDGRVDSTGQQARDPSTDADRHPSSAQLLSEVVKRIVGQGFDVNRELRVVEIDGPLTGFLDPPADLALDLRR